jgi:hypothetical protein
MHNQSMSNKPIVIAQNPRAQVEIEVSGTNLLLRPKGDINEDLNFGKVYQSLVEVLAKTNRVTIDFGFLGKINSCGVREWLLFLEKLQLKHTLHFSMINETAVSQAAVVPTLLGKPGTSVAAFEVPYFCANCRIREVRVCTPDQINSAQGRFSAPAALCNKCHKGMEFDGLENEYADVLKHRKPVKA